MLLFMRALPGRASRAGMDAPPASVTRSTAHADQRRRILRAVGEVVAERGYSDVTVEMIVKRAHVSFKTFYKHYSSKEACFVALFETAFAITEGRIRERLAEDLPWTEKVVLALKTLVEQIVADPVIARAVVVESLAVGPAVAERFDQATKALVPLLREGRQFHPRGAELPATIEDALAGAVFWSAYERLMVGESEELVEYMPVLLELILRTYIGQAEASAIARSGLHAAQQPALA